MKVNGKKFIVGFLAALSMFLGSFGTAAADPPPNNCPAGTYPRNGGCYQPPGRTAPNVFRCTYPRTLKISIYVLENGTTVSVKKCVAE